MFPVKILDQIGPPLLIFRSKFLIVNINLSEGVSLICDSCDASIIYAPAIFLSGI